jgi:membrane protease subunit (stomatin/prohibitin family)
VNIIDESHGFTTYHVAQPVQIYPNNDLADNLLETAMTNDPRNQAVVSLNTGNLKTVANFVTTLTTQINFMGTTRSNTSDENQTIAEQNRKAELREVLINQLKDMPTSDISSIKMFSTALSSTTQDTKEISRAAAVSYIIFYFPKNCFII